MNRHATSQAHLGAEREGEVLPGTTIEERLAFLNSDVAAYYTVNHVHCRLPSFKRETLEADEWPVLKGQNV